MCGYGSFVPGSAQFSVVEPAAAAAAAAAADGAAPAPAPAPTPAPATGMQTLLAMKRFSTDSMRAISDQVGPVHATDRPRTTKKAISPSAPPPRPRTRSFTRSLLPAS